MMKKNIVHTESETEEIMLLSSNGRTSPFQGGDTGSIPVGSTKNIIMKNLYLYSLSLLSIAGAGLLYG